MVFSAPLLAARAVAPMMEPLITRDFGIAAGAFFSNMRVPAALIAAAAIKDAFVMQSAPEDVRAAS